MHQTLLLGAACALAATLAPAQIDPSLLAGMKARSIGPAGMSGRVVALDAVERQPRVLYVGAATGGLWKSTNGGLTFQPIFDDQPVASIGAIRIFQASPDIVWVGTGEGNPRNSVSVGNGVYRSNDGGRTWTHLGLEKTERIRRIWVHPDNPDVALVAALGTSWGENPERGLFRTVDGGRTWNKVLYVDERTGCIDIEVDPDNPKKMFASMWDHRRKPWTFRSGGKGSGLYRSVDGGTTWKRLDATDGLPKGILGRIRPAFAPSRPSTVYALVEAKKSVLLRSDDGGFSFRVVNRSKNIAPRPFYYCDLRVDPKNPERLYNLHSMVDLSEDGGKTFKPLIGWSQAHPDHHAMWICPSDPELIYDGNDGGVAISRDHGKTWDFATKLPLAQFYHIAVDNDHPYHVYGGLQDNGSWRGPNTVWENGGIRNHHWDEVCFGDGFATLPDPEDSLQGYAMSQGGNLVRWNLRTGARVGIKPLGPKGVELRFHWNAAIAQDPFDAGTIYYGSQFVHRSTDRGKHWKTISKDLTTNRPQWQKQEASGGLTLDVTGAENHTTILTIAPSPVTQGVLWVGTDDGRVHVTRNGGESWTSLEDHIPDLPPHTWCPHIEASKFDAGTAFAVFDDHRRSNWQPYLYRTTDFGKTWKSLITTGIRGYCHVVEQDPVDANLLFLGTEFGLWFSVDGGKAWQRFSHGIPTCAVRALVVHPREHDLVVGTHGRAVFVIDDISPLRGLTRARQQQPLHLFAPPPAVAFQVKQTGASRFPGQGEFRGQARRRGAMLSFSVHVPDLKHPDKERERQRRAKKSTPRKKAAKAKKKGKGRKLAKDKARITVLDGDGKEVRRFERPIHLGLNRVTWSLRRNAGPRPSRTPRKPDALPSSGAPALPGAIYTVRIQVRDHTAEAKLRLQPDPREKVAPADRLARAEIVRAGEKVMARVAAVTDRMHEIEADLKVVRAKLGRMDDKPEALDKAVKAASKALSEFRRQLWGQSEKQGIVRRRGFMAESMRPVYRLASTWARPTDNDREGLRRATEATEKLVAKFNELMKGPLQKYADALATHRLEFAPKLEPLR